MDDNVRAILIAAAVQAAGPCPRQSTNRTTEELRDEWWDLVDIIYAGMVEMHGEQK